MKLQTILLACALVIPTIAGADDNKNAPKIGDTTKDNTAKKKLGETELKILSHLHHVNLMEVDMGKLAQRMGTQAVKKYGQQLVTDHSTADTQLMAFAKKRGATIPAAKADSEAEKAEMKEQMDGMAGLKKLKGADFDREYLRMMVEGHDKELAATAGHVEASADDELDTILTDRKVTLQRHSDNARELQKGNAQASK